MPSIWKALPILVLLLVPAAVRAAPCVEHADCLPAEKCDVLAGECVTLDDGDCRQDTDCPDTNNQYCEFRTATCRYYCSTDGHCIDDPEMGIVEYCDLNTNRCEPVPEDGDGPDSDGFCRDDWDCEVEHYCDPVTRSCVPRCTGDFDCAQGAVCKSGRCVDSEDGDDPWDYPDDPEDGDEDSFEIPEDYEMPGSETDGDEEDLGGNKPGGLSGCPAGQVCVTDGDADDESDSASEGCRQHPASSLAPVFGLLLGVAVWRRRRAKSLLRVPRAGSQ